MKIEEQVLSIDQMQHLKELGVEVKDTAIYIVKSKTEKTKELFGEKEFCFSNGFECYNPDLFDVFPTLTLQEILEMLPKELKDRDFPSLNIDLGDRGIISYDLPASDNGVYALVYFSVEEEGLLGCAYKMLCWVLENGYLNK